jgi:hypothetical protein
MTSRSLSHGVLSVVYKDFESRKKFCRAMQQEGKFLPALGSRDSVVGIATGYGLDGRGVGVRVPVEARFFSSSRRPDRLWVPLNLLSNGYRGLFPWG